MDLEKIKRIGVRAAYRAGRIINEHFGRTLHITKKGAIDLVTEADIASEKMIIETIKEVLPDHGVLAEESGATRGSDAHTWIIDPLDGTTNFAHALPIFAVSIAYAHQDQLLMGIVFNPISGELFSAIRGRGAHLNDHPIHVSAISKVSESLLVTGFPYNIPSTNAEPMVSRFVRCLTSAQGVRRLGSAALDLCYVACGRFEGFWEENLKPWDTAAGTLIAIESGARVTDYADHPYTIYDKQILATNSLIHGEMVGLLHTKE